MRMLASLAVAALAVLAVVAIASGRGSGGVTLCAQGEAGALSYAKNGKCGAGERKIEIAKTGARGRAGADGPVGGVGPAGADAASSALAPEPVRFVIDNEDNTPCATVPGLFCAYSADKFSNSGGGFARVGFSKDSSGFVHLQGLTDWVCNNNCNGSTYGDTIFYLPPGYRPAALLEFTIDNCPTEAAIRSVQVDPDGSVTLSSAGCGPDSLDGISFHP